MNECVNMMVCLIIKRILFFDTFSFDDDGWDKKKEKKNDTKIEECANIR